jgi:DNA-binding CsgD family transcriptional regulator/PAS domain-containing protein
MGFHDLSEFVGLIYDTALDPDAWPNMLDRLADLLAATTGAHFGSYNSKTYVTTNLAPRLDPEYIRIFPEYWASRDIFWQRGANHPLGAVYMPETFMSREEHRRTDIFNEWYKPQGVEAMMRTNLVIEGPVSTVVTVGRRYSEGDFGAREIRLFAALIPHLQRAVQLQLRLAGVDGPPTGSAEILNRLLQGVLLVDSGARVIFANSAAERMLRAGNGLFLGRDGLRAEASGETRLLRRIIAHCAEPRDELGGAGGRLRLSRKDRAPLTVLVIPHRARIAWIDVARPRAILFITDPEEAALVRRENLRQDFGLTPAEAGFTREVLKADGLQAAADRLGISLTTARTHLAHVFDKTGTRRQAELVRLILQSQPAMRTE